jgi:2-polyprenyl-6-methoxyphenol hydroxylase-like FAD-dependent oxidoreductase
MRRCLSAPERYFYGMNTTIKNQNILISGASIAGPALAFWLNKYGFNVTLVEKTSVLREGGYRVDIRGVAVDVAERMGLMNKIRQSGTVMRGSSFINNSGKRLVSMADPDMFGMRQPNDAEIMRGDLSNILYEATRNDVTYIFNDSIADIVQTAEDVQVTFKSGQSGTFDLVVAADGLHSNVRNIAFGDSKNFIQNFGYYFAIFSIPNFFELDHWELSYMAESRVMNVFSTGDHNEAKALFMFASDTSDYNYRDTEAQKKTLYARYKDDGGEISKVMNCLAGTPDFYFDSISQVHMDSLSRGRVVLLGDAGYCPSPAAGQGTSLALVGAYTLAGELATASGDYQLAFNRYEKNMGEFIAKNQDLIKGMEQMFPKSKRQVWLQTNAMRLMLRLPWKEKILKGMFKKVQQKVDDAANGITLKDYKAFEKEAV